MTNEERKTLVKSYLGKTVNIKIDRPIGYVHNKKSYSLTYHINYGYIPVLLVMTAKSLTFIYLVLTSP